MTRAEFDQAAMSLGIRFKPEITDEREIQWYAADDPEYMDRASVTREEGRMLADMAAGKRVIEIGTGLGISTVCLAFQAISVDTVDPNKWVLSALTFPPNVKQHASFDSIPTTSRFDVAFIDGLHSPSHHVANDIKNCISHMAPGGIVAFHDAHWTDVLLAIDEFEWRYRTVYPTVGTLTVCTIPQPVAA